MDFSKPATSAELEKVSEALKANGVDVIIVDDEKEAKHKALSLIPHKSEVMDMTSVTLSELGISEEINESGKYDSVKKKLISMNRETQGSEMNKLGAAPNYVIGSVHAITQNGEVVVASNTGSQLPAYSYGAQKVIWVVGGQKVVKDLDQAMKRLYDYVLPKESERAKIAYGMPRSNISKLFILNKEVVPGRITVILIKKAIGY